MSERIESIGGFRDAADHRRDGPGVRSYGQALLEAARRDERIVCLGADLSQPTETHLFRDALPERFFMMGIQEANMVGAASGMARAGDIPFAHSFCVFVTRRVYDQVACQLAYPKLNVTLAGFIPGLQTPLGVTHQAIDDVALMRALPNMHVFEPCGPEQVGAAVDAALAVDGPVYLRMQVAQGKADESVPLQPLEPGRGRLVRDGGDVAILAAGVMVREALAAADALAAEGISAAVANMASLKPFDSDLVASLGRRCRAMVTAENHSVIGGLGSAAAEALAMSGVSTRFSMIGVGDVFAEGASAAYLMRKYGLTSDAIAARARSLLA